MPETPDFDRLADVCLARVYEVRSKGLIAEHSVIVEQFRQIWNARGAADERALKAELQRALDALLVQARIEIDLEPLIKALDR
jgi:hypothetical protein